MSTITAHFGVTFKASAIDEFERIMTMVKQMDISVKISDRSESHKGIGYMVAITGEREYVDAARERLFDFTRLVGQDSYV